jgi:broad specificity phosphatase PhoE
LSELEDEAREQAEQADALPESTEVRDDLRRANERAAEAAERLGGADMGERRQAAAEARERLDEVERRLGDVADDLEGQLPPSARQDLEELRDRLPTELP